MAETRLVLGAFLTSAILAGGNAVAIRFSNRELDPLFGAGLRFLVAGLLMAGVVAATRVPLPRGRALAGALVWGLFQFVGAFGFAYYALVRVHAGLGQTLLALVPLATLLLAVLHGQERLRAAAIVGSLLGLAGIALISRDPLRASVPLPSLLAVLAGVLCFAEAAVLVRRLPGIHPVALNAVGMWLAAPALLAGSLLTGEAQQLPGRAETWAALGYVSAVGSVAVFLLYVFVIQRWGASRAAYTFVIIPFITLLLSAWLDEEPVGAGLLAGGLLVLTGVYIGALRVRVGQQIKA